MFHPVILATLLTFTSIFNPIDKLNSYRHSEDKPSGIELIKKALGKEQDVKIIENNTQLNETKKDKDKDAYIIGLDISKWNGNINWKEVKSSGVKFVIIRAGYGSNDIDVKFKQNIENAIENDMMIGIYWFSYAYTDDMARNEAQYCMNVIEPYKDKITLPIFYDFEYDSVDYAKRKCVNITKEKSSSMADIFCKTIKKQGYQSGIYTNIDYANNYFSEDVLNKYHTWIAQWTSTCTYKGHYIIWQCTDNFRINGKKFDLHRLYINRYKYDLQQSKARTKMTVSATAYSGDDITSTMIKPYWGVIAVDPSVISYGSLVYIPHFDKYFVAEDCGGGIIGKRIDIFMNSEKEARNWGVKTIDIYIIE